MTYLAIDPGYEKLGFCFFIENKKLPYHFKIIKSGLIKTKKDLLEKRIVAIYQKLNELIQRYSPKKIILEEVFFFKNQKTIVKVAMINGIINLLAGQKKIPLAYLSPLEIKESITGYGRADKKTVHKMLKRQIALVNKKFEDDEIDAIACGFTFLLKINQFNHG